MADNSQFDHAVQAVFSVCASPDVASAAMAACPEVQGSVFAGEFNDYFSGERRPQISQTLKAATGCVALVDCDRDPEQALQTMERLRALMLRNLSVVAYATKVDATYLLQAMRVGCNEFLTKPASTDALEEALNRFRAAHISEAGGQPNSGRVISFFGAKGGAGTTTLAVHLANNLVRRHRKRTLLIDHHHELGHISLYLGLKGGQYHFDELIRNSDRLDGNLLNGFVTRHTGGLEVLASPDVVAADYKSSPEEINSVFAFLRTQYDFIVVDSSMDYKDIVPTMQQSSDEVYLVSTPDVASLRDLARRVEHLRLTDPASEKLRIIINRSTSDDAVTAEQIEAAVRFPVWMAIPNNYADLVRAINAGEPIPPQHRSAFAQQINKWADKILSVMAAPLDQPTTHKKGFTLFRSKRDKKVA
ncbi:AAA family ATPase [Granulicella tundricola]|uniref:Response regulator receiver protein n=1 Tax=Granulicella tundricola (strain ATCC BAA-1859 / DSM 23138 / MP5ACTX9) TaxID=1198114 RepID=E8WXZ8_GRATM|nr:AAA family ATPase [Granulicella tundricola]ADW67537.1 response regulator receiver protein [Granulicella tundricola MP5ACTX9]